MLLIAASLILLAALDWIVSRSVFGIRLVGKMGAHPYIRYSRGKLAGK